MLCQRAINIAMKLFPLDIQSGSTDSAHRPSCQHTKYINRPGHEFSRYL